MRPWDQQEGEPTKAFKYFTYYFLELNEKERTLKNAYKRYLDSQGLVKAVRPPKFWYEAFHVWDWTGRAEAYHLYKVSEERDSRDRELRVIKETFKLDSLKDYHKAVNVWRKQLDALDVQMNEEISLAKANKRTYSPKGVIYAFEKMVVAREKLDVFARRQLNLPTIITDENADDSDNTFALTWNEPKLPSESEIEEQIQEIIRKRQNG
jgi:hypothetical protein